MTSNTSDGQEMTGAEMIIQSMIDHSVTTLFGYTGGAVLPIYDALYHNRNRIRHIRVRHEQGAVHAAEGYARSSGKVGCALVTSGPGTTNAVTGLQDALCDSIPLVVISGQVPTHLIGNDAFQECDTVGITRPCTKHNYLVKSIDDLPRVLGEAFVLAKSGRPGPVLVDVPKDVQLAKGLYRRTNGSHRESYRPKIKGDPDAIKAAVERMRKARCPVFYTGGGVINSGRVACDLLTMLVRMTGFPITSTLMGLGAFPASGPQWLGMLGMHGTYEANMAMHGCDLMICVGARFDDRITAKLDKFSPGSRKIHIDVDPSSINKNVKVEIGIVGDCAHVLDAMVTLWRPVPPQGVRSQQCAAWWNTIDLWRKRNSLSFKNSTETIKPQLAIQRLYELTKDRDTYITTGVGQHQMWAAQHYRFDKPNRFMTSGGLGTMGYGLPAAIGVQLAHPDALVVDIDGDGSFEMTLQQLAVAVQYALPVKVFILNNRHDGMVRQWQDFIHGGRRAESENNAQPDYVALARAYGCTSIRCETPSELDEAIRTMIDTQGPVVFDCRIDREENCLPMIMSGSAHNEMKLPDETGDSQISEEGKVMV